MRTAPGALAADGVTPADAPARGTYEIRVVGVLGPVLLSSLPHTAAMRLPRRTLVVTATSDDDGRDIPSMVRRLVEAGLEVVSVRRDRRLRDA